MHATHTQYKYVRTRGHTHHTYVYLSVERGFDVILSNYIIISGICTDIGYYDLKIVINPLLIAKFTRVTTLLAKHHYQNDIKPQKLDYNIYE